MTEQEYALGEAARNYIRADAAATGRPSCSFETPNIPQSAKISMDFISQEVALCLREVNAGASICRLPAELLAEVYCHLGVSDRFVASYVCHLWRNAALHYPRVWTDLEDFGPISPRLALALQRSRLLPVNLSITVGKSRSALTYLHDVKRHLRHVATLDVKLGKAYISLSTLLDMLTTPAPLLTRMKLEAFVDPRDRRPEQTLRADLFAGCAPKLSRLVLCHVLLPAAPIPALSEVVFFRLTAATEHGRAYLTAHIGLPNLVEYELNVPPAYYPNSIEPVIAPAPRLRVVRLLGSSTTPAMTLHPFANCPRFCLVQTSWHMISRVWRDCSPPSRLVVFSCGRGASVGGLNEQGISRMFKDVVEYPHTAALLAPTALHLRALVLDIGRRVDRGIPGITYPELTYLHIIMPTWEFPTYDDGAVHRSILPAWIRAPALRVFRLSVMDPAAQISPRTVGIISDFVAQLAPLGPVFLERDGIPLANVPARFIPRPVSAPLQHFLLETRVRFSNWDDWLANALDQIPEV